MEVKKWGGAGYQPAVCRVWLDDALLFEVYYFKRSRVWEDIICSCSSYDVSRFPASENAPPSLCPEPATLCPALTGTGTGTSRRGTHSQKNVTQMTWALTPHLLFTKSAASGLVFPEKCLWCVAGITIHTPLISLSCWGRNKGDRHFVNAGYWHDHVAPSWWDIGQHKGLTSCPLFPVISMAMYMSPGGWHVQ